MGIKIIPSTSWTMAKHGSKCVDIVGTDDERQITALFCGTMLHCMRLPANTVDI